MDDHKTSFILAFFSISFIFARSSMKNFWLAALSTYSFTNIIFGSGGSSPGVKGIGAGVKWMIMVYSLAYGAPAMDSPFEDAYMGD